MRMDVSDDMIRLRAWLLAAVVGIAVGGGTFVWLVSDPSLAITLGVVYAVGTRLFVEYAATLPGGLRSYDRATRWNAVFGGFLSVVAILVLNMVSAVSFEFRVALLLLVFGVGEMGLFFGIAMAREQAAAGELRGETRTPNGTGRDGAADTPGENA